MDRLVRLLLLLSAITAIGCANARTQLSRIPVINGRVTPQEWYILSNNPHLLRCPDPRCQALRALVDSYAKLNQRYLPNSMARNRSRLGLSEALPIELFLRRSSSLRPEVGRDLAVIATNVNDWTVVLLTIEIATLTDHDGRNVRRVMAALPRDSSLAGITQTAQQLCVSRHEPECDLIRRPRR